MISIIIRKIEFIDDEMRLADYRQRKLDLFNMTVKWPDKPPEDFASLLPSVQKRWLDVMALRAERARENAGLKYLERFAEGSEEAPENIDDNVLSFKQGNAS